MKSNSSCWYYYCCAEANERYDQQIDILLKKRGSAELESVSPDELNKQLKMKVLVTSLFNSRTVEIESSSTDNNGETYGQLCQRFCETKLLCPSQDLLQILTTSLGGGRRMEKCQFRYCDGATIICPVWNDSEGESYSGIIDSNITLRPHSESPLSEVQDLTQVEVCAPLSGGLRPQQVAMDLHIERVGLSTEGGSGGDSEFSMTQAPFPVNDEKTNVLFVKEHPMLLGVVDKISWMKLADVKGNATLEKILDGGNKKEEESGNGWKEYVADSGRTYYHNEKSGECSWEMLEECESKSSKGGDDDDGSGARNASASQKSLKRAALPATDLEERGSKKKKREIATNKKFLIESLGFSEDKVNKLQTGSILTLENGVLEERTKWLQQRLDLDDTALRKMIQQMPAILSFSISDHLQPKLDWLEQLGLHDAALMKVIRGNPSIFSKSISDLQTKIDWLQTRLHLDGSGIRKIISAKQQILGYSVPDKMEITLNWLQHRLMLSDEGLKIYIKNTPTLLGCTNLEPTLNFYVYALGNNEEAVALVIQTPALLGYNLEKRLQPRLKEAVDAGLTVDAGCLQSIGQLSNKKWNAYLDSKRKEPSGTEIHV